MIKLFNRPRYMIIRDYRGDYVIKKRYYLFFWTIVYDSCLPGTVGFTRCVEAYKLRYYPENKPFYPELELE